MDEILAFLIEHAELTEWGVCHAAENTYCHHCATDADNWHDQKEHHPGCRYVEMMARIENLKKTSSTRRGGRLE